VLARLPRDALFAYEERLSIDLIVKRNNVL
jgi:hypothetical protein